MKTFQNDNESESRKFERHVQNLWIFLNISRVKKNGSTTNGIDIQEAFGWGICWFVYENVSKWTE